MSSPILVTQLSQDVSLPAWMDQQELERVARQEVPDFKKIESTRCKWEVQLSQPALCVQLQVLLSGRKMEKATFEVKVIIKIHRQQEAPCELPTQVPGIGFQWPKVTHQGRLLSGALHVRDRTARPGAAVQGGG